MAGELTVVIIILNLDDGQTKEIYPACMPTFCTPIAAENGVHIQSRP